MKSFSKTRFGLETSAEQILAGINLQGKLAIWTGASAGWGKEVARVLANAGVTVYMASRNQKVLEKVRAELSAEGKLEVFAHPLDLTSTRSVEKFAEAVHNLKHPVLPEDTHLEAR